MDVDYAIRELADERRRDEAHEPGEDDQLDPFLVEDFQDLPLETFAVLPIRTWIHADRRDVRRLGPIEHGRPRDVAHKDREIDVQIAALARIDKALEVRAPPRSEHSDPGPAHRAPSVFEQPDPREDHSDSVFIGRRDDLVVAD